MADVLDMIWHDYCSPDPYDVAAEAATLPEPTPPLPTEIPIGTALDDILSQPNDIESALNKYTRASPERIHELIAELQQPSRQGVLASVNYPHLRDALPRAWVDALVDRAAQDPDPNNYLSAVLASASTITGRIQQPYVPPVPRPAPTQRWNDYAPYLALGSFLASCGAGYAMFKIVEDTTGMRLLAGGLTALVSWCSLTTQLRAAVEHEQERSTRHTCDVYRETNAAKKHWLDAVHKHLLDAYCPTGIKTSSIPVNNEA